MNKIGTYNVDDKVVRIARRERKDNDETKGPVYKSLSILPWLLKRSDTHAVRDQPKEH